MLSCLVAQTNPEWKAHVIIDGTTNDYDKVKQFYAEDNRIRFSHIEGPNNDWGHTARNYGLDNLTEEWVVMTGDDNYYAPVFVNYFMPYLKEDIKFIYCNMVHNNLNYFPVKSTLDFGRIDIGNFVSRSKYAKTIKLNTKDYNADWLWIKEYHDKFRKGKTLSIEQILYVHN